VCILPAYVRSATYRQGEIILFFLHFFFTFSFDLYVSILPTYVRSATYRQGEITLFFNYFLHLDLHFLVFGLTFSCFYSLFTRL